MTLLVVVVLLLWATGIVWWAKRPPKPTPGERLCRDLSRLLQRDFSVEERNKLYPTVARTKRKVLLISVDWREGGVRWEVETGMGTGNQRYHREEATP